MKFFLLIFFSDDVLTFTPLRRLSALSLAVLEFLAVAGVVHGLFVFAIYLFVFLSFFSGLFHVVFILGGGYNINIVDFVSLVM